MSNHNTPTPAQNARDIAALTSALNTVVSQFVRPSVQQANANRETLDRVADLLARHAEGLLTLEQRIENLSDRLSERIENLSDILSDTAQQQQINAQQQRINAQQIARNAEALTTLTQQHSEFDTRLEETRQLVAKNGSDVAQVAVSVNQLTENVEAITGEFDTRLEETRQLVAKNGSDVTQIAVSVNQLVEENQAFRESQQTQLAAIIGNARRIDRLEQQAS